MWVSHRMPTGLLVSEPWTPRHGLRSCCAEKTSGWSREKALDRQMEGGGEDDKHGTERHGLSLGLEGELTEEWMWGGRVSGVDRCGGGRVGGVEG